MRGIVRPCRHNLDSDLRAQWRAHLCGLCLTLRDSAGQGARLLTGYDIILLSVLVEAQAPGLQTATAGPCPLRGFRRATVLAASTPAMQLAGAAALLSGAASLQDKLADDELALVPKGLCRRVAGRAARSGKALASRAGFDPTTILAAPGRALAQQSCLDAGLDALLGPSGDAVAALFAHTATLAGQPANAPALGRAGAAFGRLVHLVDAATDYSQDRRANRFNPLVARATDPLAAGRVARALHDEIGAALEEVCFVDPRLCRALLGPVLEASLDRVFPRPASERRARSGRPERARRPSLALLAAMVEIIAMPAMWRRPGRQRGYYEDPYTSYRQPYRRGWRGPSCIDLLACDCCANELCEGDGCTVCCC